MFTIFSCPKPFQGHINIIQRNAIKSWLNLGLETEVILFGREQGLKEAAEELKVKLIDNVEKNEYGKPYLDSVFDTVRKIAKNNILVYANSDIIFLGGIKEAVKKINFPVYLIVGRRWDLEIKEEINFKKSGWQEKIKVRINKEGKLHNYSGIDYCVFSKEFSPNLLKFPVGIIGWDNWLIYNTKQRKIPVIDATEKIIAVHQNHDYSHSVFANEKKGRVEGLEMERSIKLAGGFSNMLTIREADWLIAEQGLKKPPFLRNIFSKMARFKFFRNLIALKRNLWNLNLT